MQPELAPVVDDLLAARPVTADALQAAMSAIMDGRCQPAETAALLTALAVRGETPDILAGAARAMRERASVIPTRREGLLGVHADFNWHEQMQAHRRLNLLVYLTPDWKPEYGGKLELWDTRGEKLERVVEPLFNRAVLFATRSDTFHGHPDPWRAPEPINRQSIAMYYYTAARPESEIRAPHNTLYRKLMA